MYTDSLLFFYLASLTFDSISFPSKPYTQ